jgi:nucleotide-binding universal stress UspA family protein
MARQGSRPILVPLDGSRAATIALSGARTLRDVTGAVLHVLHVSQRYLPPDRLLAALGTSADAVPDVILEQAVGQPEREIPRTASALGADLILMSTHGSTHDLAQTAGHVTLSVIQEAPCPVLVIRSALGAGGAEKLTNVRRILVPLDGSPETAVCVGHAAELARRRDAEICFLHVATAASRLAKGRATLSAPRYLDQPYLEMEAWCEEFVARCLGLERQAGLGVPLQLVLRRGDPAAEIERFAKNQGCNLIVAAWGGRLHGERAAVVRALLERAPCPLLFLRCALQGTNARSA